MSENLIEKVSIAIVGIFYDGYYDLWEDFLELFQKNWKDCPYPLYIVNNEIELPFEKKYNVQVIHAGKDAEYSKKVQIALKEINADYYLLLLEDFFFEKDIKGKVLDNIISIMRQQGIEYYRMQLPEFGMNTQVGKDTDDKYSYMYLINANSEYTVTCQPSIWEKNFLKKCIGNENYNAWIFEGIYCYSRYAHSYEFLSKCRVDYRNILTLRHGALQGKILPNVYKDFMDNGYIFKTQREVLQRSEYKKYLIKQKIKKVLPVSLQKCIKSILKTESVIEKYRSDIEFYMNQMDMK